MERLNHILFPPLLTANPQRNPALPGQPWDDWADNCRDQLFRVGEAPRAWGWHQGHCLEVPNWSIGRIQESLYPHWTASFSPKVISLRKAWGIQEMSQCEVINWHFGDICSGLLEQEWNLSKSLEEHFWAHLFEPWQHILVRVGPTSIGPWPFVTGSLFPVSSISSSLSSSRT